MRRGTSTTNRALPAMSRGYRGRGGFSLIESMIASVILATSAAAISSVLVSNYQQQEFQADAENAMDSGQQLLEEVAAMPLNPMTPGGMSAGAMHGFNDYASVLNASMVAAQAGASTSQFAMIDTPSMRYFSSTLTAGQIAVGEEESGSSGSNSGPGNGTSLQVSNVGSNNCGPGDPGFDPSMFFAGNQAFSTAIQQAALSGAMTPPQPMQRRVCVQRMSTLNGPADASGDLAIICVDVTDPSGEVHTVKRLITVVDAEVAKAACQTMR